MSVERQERCSISGWLGDQLFSVDVVPAALWPWAGACWGNINLSNTDLTSHQCHHLNSQQPRMCFIFYRLIISTDTKLGVESFRNQIVLFSPGRVQLWTMLGVWDVKCLSRFILSVGSRRAVGRLDKFLHEDLKIVGCKIKRYFKMCLQQSAVFIGSIKASFGSAFWPPWSGGHFYKSSQTMTSSQTSQSSGQICCWWRSAGQSYRMRQF